MALRDDTAFCAAAGLSKSTKPYPGDRKEEKGRRGEGEEEKKTLVKKKIKADD